MALVELHPEVQEYVVPLTLAEIEHRGGVADLVEDGRLVVISDVRLNIDFATIERLAKSTAAVSDDQLRRQLKKLEATRRWRPRPR